MAQEVLQSEWIQIPGSCHQVQKRGEMVPHATLWVLAHCLVTFFLQQPVVQIHPLHSRLFNDSDDKKADPFFINNKLQTIE